MKAFFRGVRKGAERYMRNRTRRRFVYLCVLLALALADFMLTGLARRTFVFYSVDTRVPVVEERMLPGTGLREQDIRMYIEETLLGPVALDSAPLFPRGVRLESLLFRDGVVYADLSEPAALAVAGGPGVFEALHTLYGGVRRNFPRVKDVRLFIAGHEAFFEKFRELFGAYADI
jgi:hypothetical protein